MCEPFTWNAYKLYLDTALESGYRFISFAGLTSKSQLPDYRFVLLRHDIDYDPIHALTICRLESERGIQATYCFQCDSPFYQLKSKQTVSVISEVLGRGHWLGLHLDVNKIREDSEVVSYVEKVANEFEVKCDASVTAVSFHMPTYRPVGHLELANGRINTYSRLFFEAIDYLSDSNQNLHGKDILRIFREGRLTRLHLLIHPIWWREKYTPLYTKMKELAAELNMSVEDILTREQLTLINEQGVAEE